MPELAIVLVVRSEWMSGRKIRGCHTGA